MSFSNGLCANETFARIKKKKKTNKGEKLEQPCIKSCLVVEFQYKQFTKQLLL